RKRNRTVASAIPDVATPSHVQGRCQPARTRSAVTTVRTRATKSGDGSTDSACSISRSSSTSFNASCDSQLPMQRLLHTPPAEKHAGLHCSCREPQQPRNFPDVMPLDAGEHDDEAQLVGKRVDGPPKPLRAITRGQLLLNRQC